MLADKVGDGVDQTAGLQTGVAPGSGSGRLTVVLPNYNHARYLPQSLGAIFAQTRPADEIIIFDDASTDDSVAVIEALIRGHTEARLEQCAVNQGCNVLVGRGLALAQGDYVHFAAADDVMAPDLFRKSLALLDRFPEAGLCSAKSGIIDEESRDRPALPAPVPLSQPGFIPPDLVRRLLMSDDSWFFGNTVVYRTAAIRRVGGFAASMGSFADGFACRRIAVEQGVCFIPEILGAWRRIPGGMAWSDSLLGHRLAGQIEVTRRAIAACPSFPSSYNRRWANRAQFGALRFALDCKLAGVAEGRGALARRALRGAAIVASVILFFRLRPFDLPYPLLRRMRAVATAGRRDSRQGL